MYYLRNELLFIVSIVIYYKTTTCDLEKLNQINSQSIKYMPCSAFFLTDFHKTCHIVEFHIDIMLKLKKQIIFSSTSKKTVFVIINSGI